MRRPLRGVLAAAPTPFGHDLGLDLDSLPALLDHLHAAGVHGVLLMGTTGEGPSLSVPERVALMRAAAEWREARGRADFLVLAGTGCAGLSDTIAATRAAYAFGLDAAVILPAFYYKSVDAEGLTTYFRHVIDAAVPRDARCILYHIPRVAGVGIPPDTLAALRTSHPGRLAGLKDSSVDIEHTRAACAAHPDLAIFTGTDSHLADALAAGAAGSITALANIAGSLARAIFDAEGDDRAATAAQERLGGARAVFDRYPSVAAVKALLAERCDLPRWSVRPPLRDLDATSLARLRAEWPGP